MKVIFCNLFQLSPEEINGSTSQEIVAMWDLSQYLNLRISIEEEFGISLNPDEITNMNNFPKVCRIVSGKISG